MNSLFGRDIGLYYDRWQDGTNSVIDRPFNSNNASGVLTMITHGTNGATADKYGMQIAVGIDQGESQKTLWVRDTASGVSADWNALATRDWSDRVRNLTVTQDIGTADQTNDALILQGGSTSNAPVIIGSTVAGNNAGLAVRNNASVGKSLSVGEYVQFGSYTTTEKNAISTGGFNGGEMIFDSTLAKMCFYNGTAWETITSA